MIVPMLDPQAQHASLNEELVEAFRRVLVSGKYILGPEVESLERAVANRLGVDFAIGVSNGSDALVCALAALGVGAGDEVITAGFGFVASAECIVRLGAIPRFVDIDPRTFNLSPRCVEAALGPRTKALLVAHLFGQPADMEGLSEIARKHSLPVVEDFAQSFGARFSEQNSGAWGDIGCTSFFPAKVLGALGDAGMIITSNPELAGRCRALRVHGSTQKHYHPWVGGNYRLDAVQAALLSVKLPHLGSLIARRREHAAFYDSAFQDSPGIETPFVDPRAYSVFAQYTVRIPRGRDDLQRHLAALGVASAVHYPLALQHQPCFDRVLNEVPTLPQCEKATREVLSLPLFPELTHEQREHVVASVRSWNLP